MGRLPSWVVLSLGILSGATGCGAGPTATLVHIDAASGLAIVALWGQSSLDGAPLSPMRALPGDGGVPRLPGTALVPTPDVAGWLTVTLTARDAQGAPLTTTGRVKTVPHEQTTLALVLGGGVGDGGLPDGGLPDGGLPDGGLPDGGPSDSGSRDLNGGDLAPDLAALGNVCMQGGPATACSGGGYLFCDGFEGASGTNFPSWTGTSQTNNAGTKIVATTSGAPVCRGSQMAESVGAGSDQYAFLYKDLTLPTSFYARTFLYVASSWGLDYANLMAFTDPNITFSVELRFDAVPGQIYVVFPGSRTSAFGVLPRGRWTCVEVFVAQSSSAGHVTVWIDGTQSADFAGNPTVPAGKSIGELQLGIDLTKTGQTTTGDIYLDEVALSSSRIGCQ